MLPVSRTPRRKTMTSATTSTFHPFPRLPAELRTRIWELTVEPRIVEVRLTYHHPDSIRVKVSEPRGHTEKWIDKRPPPMRHLRSPTAVPAQLQACREAREHLTTHSSHGHQYEMAFTEITTKAHGGFDPVPEHDPQRQRYVWFDFDNDMMSIGDTDLHDFRAVAHQVRRLRLERSLHSEYFSRTESLLIARFRELAEIHVICLEGVRSGYMVTEDIEFPCGPENVYFIDPEYMGGMMINSVDLNALVVREYEESLE